MESLHGVAEVQKHLSSTRCILIDARGYFSILNQPETAARLASLDIVRTRKKARSGVGFCALSFHSVHFAPAPQRVFLW
jgi:hypothetical protein